MDARLEREGDAAKRDLPGRLWLWAPLAGGLAASGMPPWHFVPGLLGLALLPVLAVKAGSFARAFGLTLLFGFPFFLINIHWVAHAFWVKADEFGALAIPGVLALALIMAATAALPVAALALVRWRSPWALASAAALAWMAGEWIRLYGTQFPWNPLAVAWTVTDGAMQPLAWLGTHGVSTLTALIVALPGAAWLFGRWKQGAALAFASTLALAGAGYARLAAAPEVAPLREDVNLRVVQANVERWPSNDRDAAVAGRRAWLERHMALSGATSLAGLEGGFDAVIWPESGVPYRLDDERGRAYIASAVEPGSLLLTGADFYGPSEIRNSLYALAADGEELARYDKVDLVPFGEFLPFKGILSLVGLQALAVSASDFSRGDGRATLDLEGLPPFSPLICYEAIFPGRATDGTGRAEWLLNVTNDGWFGMSAGPYQHLAMARTRAVETGLPLVRAAITGVSAITDPYGRVLQALPLGQAGVIDAQLPEPKPAPPLVAQAPWLAWLPALVAFLSAIVFHLKARKLASDKPLG